MIDTNELLTLAATLLAGATLTFLLITALDYVVGPVEEPQPDPEPED